MFETRITKMLGIRYPIIGGTMASISDADFVAAISNAGGIGILASIIYQTKDDFAAAIDRIRELSDRPFAINLNFFPAQFPVSQQEYTEIMVEKGVKIVETSGHMAPPEDLCGRFKEAGMIWIHKCVGLRYALKAQNLIGTLVLVPTVAKVVQVPVIGGGGVSDGHGFAAVLSLGAEGVIMGTRLLATQECPIHESLKQALVSATELDTMLIMRSVGTHRVWTNAAATKCAEIEATGASFEEILKIVSGDNSRRVYYEGDLDCGVVPCGQGIGQVHDIPTVKDLFDGIIAQATEVVTGLVKS